MKPLRIDRRAMNAEREARQRERERTVQFNLDDDRHPGADCAEVEREIGLPIARPFDPDIY